MKMKQKKIGIASALVLVVLVMLGLYGASNYMLNYSLNYPKEERMTAEEEQNEKRVPLDDWLDGLCVSAPLREGYLCHDAVGLQGTCHLSLCTEDYGKDSRGGAWLSGALRGNAAHRLSL